MIWFFKLYRTDTKITSHWNILNIKIIIRRPRHKRTNPRWKWKQVEAVLWGTERKKWRHQKQTDQLCQQQHENSWNKATTQVFWICFYITYLNIELVIFV